MWLGSSWGELETKRASPTDGTQAAALGRRQLPPNQWGLCCSAGIRHRIGHLCCVQGCPGYQARAATSLSGPPVTAATPFRADHSGGAKRGLLNRAPVDVRGWLNIAKAAVSGLDYQCEPVSVHFLQFSHIWYLP